MDACKGCKCNGPVQSLKHTGPLLGFHPPVLWARGLIVSRRDQLPALLIVRFWVAFVKGAFRRAIFLAFPATFSARLRCLVPVYPRLYITQFTGAFLTGTG